MAEKIADLPQIGEYVRVWYGSGFIREGYVIDRNEQSREVLVRFVYDIPDAWASADRLC
jgi:hypothetical protein